MRKKLKKMENDKKMDAGKTLKNEMINEIEERHKLKQENFLKMEKETMKEWQK